MIAMLERALGSPSTAIAAWLKTDYTAKILYVWVSYLLHLFTVITTAGAQQANEMLFFVVPTVL